MASIKNLLFLFAVLVAPTIILAQRPSANDSSPNEPLSSPPQSASGPFDHFPFKIPKSDWPGAGFFTKDSRQKREVGRLVISCNYATEGGSKCTNCNTVQTCYPINIGTIYTCSGLFQYCNNGQCSRTKGPLCS